MRLSTELFFDSSLQNLQKNMFELNKTQLKIATGRNILQPSEDPINNAKMVQLQERQSSIEQYQENITIAENRLTTSESVLGNIVRVLQRARELGIQSDNGSLSEDDHQIIASELRQLTLELKDLMNTTDGLGGYLFGGYQTQQSPFIERNGGGFDYVGDEGVNLIQVASSTFVPVSDPGRDLFVDVNSSRSSVVTRASETNSQSPLGYISSGIIRDQDAFDAAYPENYTITFNDPELNQNRQTFTVTRSSDGSPVLSTSPGGYLVNVPYSDGQTIEFQGVEIAISGSPQTNDVFFVESTTNQSVLNLIDRFSDSLTTLTSSDQTLPISAEVIGRATPGKSNLNTAGNYVAAQTIRVTSENGTIETLTVAQNDPISTVVTGLNAMSGVSASVIPTVATFDISNSTVFEGETISFSINGAAVSATVGANTAATYANLDAAITTALAALPNLSHVNNGDGTYVFTESTGADIGVENFAVVDLPRTDLNILGGITAGDAISFDLIGSAGETVNVSYTAVTGTVDELLSEMQTDITASGSAASFSLTQPGGAGTAIQFRYLGDTNGSSSVRIANFTDAGGNNAQLVATPSSGTQVVNETTAAVTTLLGTGTDFRIEAIESRATAQLTGSIGEAVTLLENNGDSSAVAGRFTYSLAEGYAIDTDVAEANGGLVPDGRTYDEIVRNRFFEAVNIFIDDIERAENAVIQARSEMGSRLNQLTEIEDLNVGTIIELESFISEIRDVDFAQATTDLNFQSFILEASQTTFVRISQLNLFNLL